MKLIPKPNLPTMNIMGMHLPIIADLGDGWFLVAHQNGAAISNNTYLTVLWSDSTETTIPSQDWSESKSPIPEVVRAKAVEEFERLAWPEVRGLFYMEVR